MLTKEEIAFFNENSYLRMKGVYSPDEVDAMSRELDHVIENFVTPSKGWQGPWRKDSQYLSDDEESKTMLAGYQGVAAFLAGVGARYSESAARSVHRRPHRPGSGAAASHLARQGAGVRRSVPDAPGLPVLSARGRPVH